MNTKNSNMGRKNAYQTEIKAMLGSKQIRVQVSWEDGRSTYNTAEHHMSLEDAIKLQESLTIAIGRIVKERAENSRLLMRDLEIERSINEKNK